MRTYFVQKLLWRKLFLDGALPDKPIKIFAKRSDGLVEHYRNLGDNEYSGARHYFFNDDIKFLMMNCNYRSLARSCYTIVWLPSRNTAWEMYFPIERIDDWSEIVQVTLKKLAEWREK